MAGSTSGSRPTANSHTPAVAKIGAVSAITLRRGNLSDEMSSRTHPSHSIPGRKNFSWYRARTATEGRNLSERLDLFNDDRLPRDRWSALGDLGDAPPH